MDRNTIPPEAKPVIAGLLIFGAGVLMRNYQPSFMNLPQPMQEQASAIDRFRAGNRAQGIAVGIRDSLLMMLPHNFMDWLGRGLITFGGAMAAAKLIDLIIDDDLDDLID